MAYADNDGVRIHYQMEGDGSPLVLQHGYSDSLESWYDLGYVNALKAVYQVILIDARGHGASDKPHQTAQYTRRLQAADIVAVLDDLSIPRADYLGYSMGGQIGFAVAQYAADRVRGLIIGGAAGGASSRTGDRFLAALDAGGAEVIPGLLGVPLPPALRDRLIANDAEALKACRMDHPGFANIFSTMAMPCLVYAGATDPVYAAAEAAAAKMPNGSFFGLPHLGHAEVMLHSELVLPRVIDFLSSLNR
jgi:pimeloyl-ACP methyl ester carboxylesterase